MRGKLVLTGMLFVGSTILSDGSIAFANNNANSFIVEEVKPGIVNEQSTVVSEKEDGTLIEKEESIGENGSSTEEVLSSKDNLTITEEETNPVIKESTSESIQTFSTQSIQNPSVKYSTHVENIGWLGNVSDGKMSGTAGKSLRLEGIKISLGNAPFSGGITYKTHVQDYGWLNNVSDGALSGTTGEAKRLEAIQINLTGEMAKHYDIYYRVHAETYGWLDWAKNGASAGTQGLTKRLEAIEIVLVAKGGAAPGATNRPLIIDPSVVYSTHVQDYGWLAGVSNGKMSGTQGQAKRMEAIKISLKNSPYFGSITYNTHVQDYGWLRNASNGAISGTSGEAKRLEAIQINLTGEMAQHYDIYYRVHAETYGWLDWAKNGASAGTQGLSKRLEAIEVVLVAKGGAAPGSTKNPFIMDPSVVYTTHVQDYGWLANVSDGEMSGTQGQAKRMEAIKISLKNTPYIGGISYRTHVQDYGWLTNVTNGALSGTSGKSKRLEAIEMQLTGEMAQHYDIYYRVHAETYGWLDWAKNGASAGTKGLSKRLEAIEIVLVAKGGGAPGATNKPFIEPALTYVTNNYNMTLNNALNMQMKVTPQTDKYRDAPAYVSSQYINVFNAGKISGSSVNLRTSPDTVSKIAANVGNGTIFKLLDNNVTGEQVSGSTKWYKIEYNGEILYVHSSLATANLRMGQVTEGPLNIRADKSATSHIYSSVKAGTLLTILEEDKSGWYRVSWGSWRNAKSADVLPYLDPTKFINDEKQRFQFMSLTKTSGVSKETLNKYLVGKGILEGQGQAFIDAGIKYGINEVYLMAHTLLETGHGTSTLAKGIEYQGKKVYNMYGVGALDHCPDECGAETAFEKGWFSPYDAIVGGAFFIDNGYLGGNNYYGVVQNTIYEMRWNPEVMATLGSAGHQYATDIGWAYKQVSAMYDVYKIQPYN
ncbi:SH3 domain-containing protein, partial [Neobacillus vireti]|uniref:SH3 domain-containing protein n=1 Tax=Neobacillus vireti TaxID=220686 RepID=UPI0030007C60